MARLGVSLDLCARNVDRLWDTLALSDERLIAALGGSRRDRLHAWHAGWSSAAREQPPPGIDTTCRHAQTFPDALRAGALAPHALYVVGGLQRMREIASGRIVAIVGTRRCTDHAMEVARRLGRELAGAGVSVIGELTDGISFGAHAGALEVDGNALALVGGGVDRCSPQCCGQIYRRMKTAGCVVAELPCGAQSRRWAQLARARTLALLAELVVVVEASEHPRELACAQLARALGKKLAAVPGRVGSHSSLGTNRLLREGATLVRGAHDALEALYEIGPGAERPAAGELDLSLDPSLDSRLRLDTHLQAVIRQIGQGRDTLAALSAGRRDIGALLADLAELELRGLVVRGDGDRYLANGGVRDERAAAR
jgi:DNA processing protein